MDVRQLVIKVGKITRKLMAHYHRTKIEKQDIADLRKNIDEVDKDVNLPAIINALEFAGFVEKEVTILR